MMEKVIEVGSWDGPGMDHPVNMIKISNQGLIGNDRADFLKIASHVFADMIDNVKVAADEIPIHINAIGATEGYGMNRNGDAFKEAYCKATHDRFVKDARYYRNHKNKDPQQSYGHVKLSAYNNPMRRIELMVFGNTTKSAAERNGGLQMKQASVDKLNNGELIPWSMATKIAYDECDNCHNKAANRSQYCDETNCINPTDGFQMFGCKDGLTKVASNGRAQFVENPNPYFFDISEVIRPADRIAHGGYADYMQKAASENHTMGGAELAEMWARRGGDFSLLSPEDTIFRQKLAFQLSLVRELAEIERNVESSLGNPRDIAYAHSLKVASYIRMNDIPLGSTKMATALKALADSQVVIPLNDFLAWTAPGDVDPVKVAQHLPGIFGRLIDDPSLESSLHVNPFLPDTNYNVSTVQALWAEKHAAALSIDASRVQDRVFKSVINQTQTAAPSFINRESMVKTASDDEPHEKIARSYAFYKLAFLTSLPKSAMTSATKRLVILQNYLNLTQG